MLSEWLTRKDALGQQRDNYCLVSVDRQIGHAPAGSVSGVEGYLLTFLESEFFEYQVEFFDLSGHLAIGEGVAPDAVECCFVPILSGCILKTLQIMRIICHY